MNPYEQLGVPRDATAAEVGAAFKKKAKRAHPDAGGKAEDFDQLSKCRALLCDAKRRADYDRTGKFDEPEPDNAHAQACQLATQCVFAVFAAIEKQGMCIEDHDVVALAISDIKTQLKGAKAHCVELRKEAKRAQKTAKRFSHRKNAPSFLRRALEARADEIARGVVIDEKQIDIAEAAIKILADEVFEIDAPPTYTCVPVPDWVINMGAGGF